MQTVFVGRTMKIEVDDREGKICVTGIPIMPTATEPVISIEMRDYDFLVVSEGRLRVHKKFKGPGVRFSISGGK